MGKRNNERKGETMPETMTGLRLRAEKELISLRVGESIEKRGVKIVRVPSAMDGSSLFAGRFNVFVDGFQRSVQNGDTNFSLCEAGIALATTH